MILNILEWIFSVMVIRLGAITTQLTQVTNLEIIESNIVAYHAKDCLN